MKFKEEDTLYYVDPFVFTIDLVTVKMAIKENGHIYYIDEVGAWLAEWDLFKSVEEVKGEAIKRLNKFYGDKLTEIMRYSQIENNGECL